MIFRELEIPGVYLVEPERHADIRGFFARTWCREELEAQGLDPALAQCNISHNKLKGTVRGMHWQAEPWPESKLVRCTSGAIWDVALDLRRGSPTYLRHVGVELTRENRRALYVPVGVAHGFQSLEDDSEVFYQMSEFFHPEASRGVRWDDPAFSIEWPLPVAILSQKDRSWPDWEVESE